MTDTDLEATLTDVIARAAHSMFASAPAQLVPWEKLTPAMREKFLQLFGAPMTSAVAPTVRKLIEDARTADREAVAKVREITEAMDNNPFDTGTQYTREIREALDGTE